MEIFQTCKCNLLDDKLALTYSEKENIAKRYFSCNYTHEFKSLFKYDFLPLLCKFYFNKSFSIQSILKDPFHCYRRELNNLFLDCKEGKYKICALLFLTLCNNHVEKKYLAVRDKRFNKILEDIRVECGINEGLTGKFLMKELDVLTGTFVSDDKEFYHTIHDKLFDFMALYFGTKNEVTKTEFIGLLIKHADYNFIRERFVIVERDEAYRIHGEVYLIAIQDNNISLYIERIFSDLTKSDCINSFLKDNKNSMNKSFQNALSTFIQQLPKDTISSLIQNASSDFICSMFVTNVIQIEAYCKSIWYIASTEHYGIILDHDHIQEYIERMFNDMTKSDDVVNYMEKCRCCGNEAFRTELLIFISKLGSIKVTYLIRNASKSFVMHMFVMKVDDIHQGSESIHERYGIVITGDHIHVFSERFLSELKYCDDVTYYINLYRCSRNNDFNTAIQSCMASISSGKIKELIENASNSFIQNMFVITVEDTKQISRHVHRHYGIEIPGDVIQFYIERVFEDLKSSKDVNEHLQCNRNRTKKTFQTRLKDYMKQLGELKIKQLVGIASQDFIDRLSVMSINDIRDISDPEYKKYGVIISGDIIQVYIERVFDDLTCSKDVYGRIRRNRNKRNTIFQTRLQDYMRQLSKPRIKHLIRIAGQDFIDRLCVMSIDDIKDTCVFQYERYGVIIPEDSLWLYVARWFHGMITLDNTDKYVERNRNRKTKLFKTSVCTFTQQLQDDEIKELIQTGSADFLHKWFVTEDIKDNSTKGYKQYGINLKDKNLQKYNERILTLMKYNLMYNQYRVPRSVMTYISELQILRMTELINEANLDVFHKMITVDSVKDLRLEKIYAESQSVDYVIHNNFQMKEDLIRCPESLINQYMDRMISDWGKGETDYVINNNNLKNQSFVDRFIGHLNSLEPFKISQLLQTKDYNIQNALTICCKYGEVNLATWCLESCLHGNPQTKQNQLCALLLLVVFNGRLAENVLHDEFTKVNDVILSFSEMHDIRECTTFSDVKEQLDVSLKECIVKTEGAYHVKCARVFDFLVFYFAWNQKMSQILVDYADEILLYNKFWVKPPISKQNDFIFHLSDEQLQACIERVFKCLSKSEKNIRYVLERRNDIIVKSVTAYIRKLNAKEINIIFENACIDFLNKMCIIDSRETKDHIVEESVLHFVLPNDSISLYIEMIFDLVSKSHCVVSCLQDNRNAKNEIFRSKLSFYMTEINRDNIEKLINQASSDFISRMFITSAVNIKDESCWEYERYGIFVPEEFLQMYIKRVFSDMTQSVNVPVNRNSENKTFQDAFKFYTNSLSEDILEPLIQTASSKFISRLYLTTEENITDISSREFKYSMVLVPKKFCGIFKQKMKEKLKMTHSFGKDLCKSITRFEIENDSFSLIVSTFEKKHSDDVLIQMKRKNKKNIGNLQEHLEKYIDPLFTCKTIECCIRSTQGRVRKYIQRMLGDWIEGHIYDVFDNINLENLSFQCEFLNYLRNTDNTMQTKLANTNDNRTSDSPLAVSCSMGISQLVEWCLDQNININSLNIYQEHPLYIACTQNLSDIVFKILNHKTNIDKVVYFATLHMACERGFSEIVLHLLKKKEDINCDAILMKHIGTMIPYYSSTPLFTACKHGCEKIVSILLECKANEIDINKGTSVLQFQNPLYIACKEGHKEIVSLLLNHSADEVDLNKKTCKGETPLYTACEAGYTDIVYLLLEKESLEINRSDINGTTPLFVACQEGHEDLVFTLLSQDGIEVDKCMVSGMSPLFIASLLGHTKIVEMLLNRNADSCICVREKEHVKQLFEKLQQCRFSQKHRRYEGLDINTYIAYLKRMVGRIASKHWKSQEDGIVEDWESNLIFGSSPLHIGCALGHTEIVKLLVDKISDINSFNEDGSTPLGVASNQGYADIVSLLLEKGANPTLVRKKEKSLVSMTRRTDI